MWQAETRSQGGKGMEAKVSQWVMLLLLLNPTSSQVEGDLGEQRPLPPSLLSSSFALGISAPLLEAITPSRLQPWAPGAARAPP